MEKGGGVPPSPIPDIPIGLTAVWIDDFARLTVNAVPVDVEVEWYESEDGSTYTLIDTTAVGINTLDNYTWQNQLMYFKCRAVKGGLYSDYTAAISMYTPIVHVSGSGFAAFGVIRAGGQYLTIDWGDGTVVDLPAGNNFNKSHIYAAGTWYGKLYVTAQNGRLVCSEIALINSGTSKQQLNKYRITGSTTTWSGYGNISDGRLDDYIMYQVTIRIDGCNFTSLPVHGLPERLGTFNAQTNNVLTADIDAFLNWLATYFATVNPIKSCTYTLNGAGMGSPTDGASNTDIVAIKALYTAAGFTATFTINT